MRAPAPEWTAGEPALRARWGLDPAVTFLNHGSFGAAPLAVLAEQARLRAEMEREPVEFLFRRIRALLHAVRERVAAFVNADPAGLVFVPNATTGANSVLRSLEFARGDEIVVTDHGYQAVRQALRYLEDRFGVRAVIAKVPFPIERPAQIVDAVAAALGERARLLVVDHVTSPTGLVFPAADLAALARSRGVPVLVDGAHAPAQLPLDLARIGADFYTGNLHKWLCAPKGAAFLFVAERWRERIHPLTISHGYGQGMREEFDWTGTVDPTAWLAVPAAIDHFEALGAEKVRASNHALVRGGRLRVAEALGVDLPHPDEPLLYGSMAAIPFPSRAPATPERVFALSKKMFDLHRIEVPFTAFDDRIWVRISGQVYNSPADYERLADALRGWRAEER